MEGPIEHCCLCGEPTGRAGIGEDSLYFGDSGPYCEECHGKVAEVVNSELHNLLSTLSDIRTALGVGDKPMLSELAGIVREVREQADRDEKAACKAKEERVTEIERLEAERDDFHDTLMRVAAYIGHDMADGADHSSLLDDVIRMNKERDATKRERDEAVEALRRCLPFVEDDEKARGTVWDAGDFARAVLAKIGGQG